MENKQKNANRPNGKKLLWVLLAVLVVAAISVAVAVSGGSPDQTPPQETLSGTEQPLEEFTGYEVTTPIGVVCYPERWMEAIEVEQKTTDGTFTAVFYGKLDTEKVQLFTLYVGAAGQGYLMGSKDDQSVWMDVQVIEPAESWSEEEAKQITEMQDCVNDVMYQIYTLDGFVKTQPET